MDIAADSDETGTTTTSLEAFDEHATAIVMIAAVCQVVRTYTSSPTSTLNHRRLVPPARVRHLGYGATVHRTDQIIDFVHDTKAADIPASAMAWGRRCLLDLIGVAAAGRATELSRIINDHAAAHFGPGAVEAPLLFDGRVASPAGAALAAGMTIDAIDAHDGHRLTKGHTGAHQLPALLAFTNAEGLTDSRGFLTSLVVGYEFATRAGIALHTSVPDYHTSGAWGAVGAAALGARLLGLDRQTTFEAMGIGEYHGPRSQMMRVIDHPTMLKDGSGWGAMAGVSAAYLAADGFTGAPAVTISSPEVANVWDDLGSRWIIEDQYFKPYPVCRWAQPAVEAALAIVAEHDVRADSVLRIEVHTFHEACRLATALPTTTEQAQYSLPFPVAAAVVRGRLGGAEVGDSALADPAIRRLAAAIEMIEDDEHNRAFPARRYARVVVELAGGERLASSDHEPQGEPESSLSDAKMRRKFATYSTPALGSQRAAKIETLVDDVAEGTSLELLLSELSTAVNL